MLHPFVIKHPDLPNFVIQELNKNPEFIMKLRSHANFPTIDKFKKQVTDAIKERIIKTSKDWYEYTSDWSVRGYRISYRKVLYNTFKQGPISSHIRWQSIVCHYFTTRFYIVKQYILVYFSWKPSVFKTILQTISEVKIRRSIVMFQNSAPYKLLVLEKKQLCDKCYCTQNLNG